MPTDSDWCLIVRKFNLVVTSIGSSEQYLSWDERGQGPSQLLSFMSMLPTSDSASATFSFGCTESPILNLLLIESVYFHFCPVCPSLNRSSFCVFLLCCLNFLLYLDAVSLEAVSLDSKVSLSPSLAALLLSCWFLLAFVFLYLGQSSYPLITSWHILHISESPLDWTDSPQNSTELFTNLCVNLAKYREHIGL